MSAWKERRDSTILAAVGVALHTLLAAATPAVTGGAPRVTTTPWHTLGAWRIGGA